jgi:uridine monophosphate synthetase
MSFFSRLENRTLQADSLLCVGLDPHVPDLPAPTAEAARDFCLRLIEATSEVAAAFKPNSAFFEAFGPQGIAVLAQVIASVPAAIPVILDAKRGDIASTAEAYARAVFRTLGASAVTVSPYLGRDSVEPFLADAERGVFLLCKTSNPGAADLQDLQVSPTGHPQDTPALFLQAPPAGYCLYEHVALLAQAWNSRDNVGLVVGSTQPEALYRVRALAPGLWILAPGVGAQGGDLRLALQAGLRADGLGMLIPVSRTLSRAADPARVARELRDQINCERAGILGAGSMPPKRVPPSQKQELEDKGKGIEQSSIQGTGETSSSTPFSPIPHPLVSKDEKIDRYSLADGLLKAGCVKFGTFTLKSGLDSPIYIDLRQLVSYPSLLGETAAAYVSILRGLTFDRLAALPYAALPIGTAISLRTGWPLVYPRKEVKTYGTKAEIEGLFTPGERVAVVDDLTTTGGSKFEAIEKLTAVGLQVSDVVVLIDRQSGAVESLAQAGYRLHAVFTLAQLIDHWEANGKVPPEQIAAARVFIGR